MPMKQMKLARMSVPGAAALTAYKRSYKGGGASDFHFPIFQAAAELTDCKSVLYAGSHRHLTMSLAFPDVLYVDSDERVGDVFASTKAAEYVSENKTYGEEHALEFCCADYTQLRPDRKFDLLASLSAGQAAPHCSKHVREGGFILASDAHSDARTALLMDCWELFAAWDDETETFTTKKDTLDRCFRVRGTGDLISAEQVRESIEIGTVRKRKFKLMSEPMFYLFRKKV
ncbi:unnamed protein product [Ectocarpus fasciculatus]